ncbi:MAG TPA: hypothetical protein VFF40_11255 [Acidimicrobiia bacterium]|nr:hypothetical protein [Acidimicrobiia bacterium]
MGRSPAARMIAAVAGTLAVAITTAAPAHTMPAGITRAGTTRAGTTLTGATSAPRSALPADGPQAEASTSPAGAHVRIGFDGAYWEQGTPGGGATGSSGGGGCIRRWEPAGTGAFHPQVISLLIIELGPAPSPEHRPFTVWCGDAIAGWAWILPSEFNAATGPSAAEIAAEIAADLPYPQITVGVNPAERGLAGLETWVWTEGYDGTPITDSVTGLGATVEVEARPINATWDFGDDIEAPRGSVGSLAGGAGEPAARHIYERRSGPEGFALSATFSFAVRYRVDGGEWSSLPSVARSASRAYIVADSQAQLVTGPGD